LGTAANRGMLVPDSLVRRLKKGKRKEPLIKGRTMAKRRGEKKEPQKQKRITADQTKPLKHSKLFTSCPGLPLDSQKTKNSSGGGGRMTRLKDGKSLRSITANPDC